MYEIKKNFHEMEDKKGQKVITTELYIKGVHVELMYYGLQVTPGAKRIEVYDFDDSIYSFIVTKDYTHSIQKLKIKLEFGSKKKALLTSARNRGDTNDFVLIWEAIDKLIDNLLALVTFYSKQLSKKEN